MSNSEPINEEVGLQGAMAIELLIKAILSIQTIIEVDDFRMAAYVGQALGDVFGCGDCKFEARAKELTEEQKEPYKQTVLLNFNDAYNKHRSMHESSERCAKPKPKIV